MDNLQISQKNLLSINRSKKRPNKLLQHKDVRAKRSRNSGEIYTGRNGVNHFAKLVPGEKVCSPSCTLSGCSITQEEKINLFHQFYETFDWNLQSTFLMAYIDVIQTEQQNTLKYYVPVGGVRLQVCRKTMCDIFKISARRLRTCSNKKTLGKIFAVDMRGKHVERQHSLPQELWDAINDHILTFPTYLSHYCRHHGDPEQQYLSPDLSIISMYKKFRLENVELLAGRNSLWAYRQMFRRSGIKIGIPKADTCKKCDALKIKINSTHGEEQNNVQDLRNAHHDLAQSAYISLANDETLAKVDESFVCICLDLEQVLFCPTLSHSDIFYQRQLSSYNFCLVDSKTGNVKCAFWNESEGKRGSVDMGSCILSYIEQKYPLITGNETRRAVFWSDRCVGQNNNWLTLALYKLLISKRYFTSIEQKFLVTGHSFLPNDRNFALIEKRKKKMNVFVPDDWITVILSAKPSNPFEIQRMSRDKFVNIDRLNIKIPKPPKLHVTEHLWYKMENSDPSGIYTRPDHDSMTPWNRHNIIYAPHQNGVQYKNRRPWSTENISDLVLQPCYLNPLPINANKKKDLLEMCEFLEPCHRIFYENLITHDDIPHENDELLEVEEGDL